MKASIKWILVFVTTRFTHLKRTHRRVRAVVWNILDNREARSAVGAVNEWIPITTIPRIEQLAQTIITGGDVRRNRSKLLARGIAFEDLKVGIIEWDEIFKTLDRLDRR